MIRPSPTPLDLRGADVPLRLWDHGGGGTPVLFLHGYLDSARSFDDLAAAAAPELRALCLDLRGHGGSHELPPGVSFHQLDHLKDLDRVLEALHGRGLAPAAVVAHSMGGSVALTLAGCRPDSIPRLLLLDSMGALPEEPEEQPKRLAEALAAARGARPPFPVFRSREEAAARVRANNPGMSATAARRLAALTLVPHEEGWTFPLDPRLRGPSPIRYPSAYWTALCARVSCPVHVLAPERGYATSLPDLDARLAALRDVRFQIVPGSGHHLHLEEPGLVLQALHELLERPLVEDQAHF